MNNIYKRQMNELGLDIDQYSNMVDIPKKIVKKMISGNGEVVKDMEINNFLRKNLFTKHQEIEENKEEKKIEALDIKMKKGENSFENKKQFLLDKYPDSKEVQWYINEYDKDTYFKKYNVKNKYDLMKKYKFKCNKGRLRGLKEVGESTIDRLINKQYNELGKDTAYTLICQLYDCFELGHIKENQKIQIQKEPKEYLKEEQELRDWYKDFDLEKFVSEKSILYKDIAEAINIPCGSVYPMKKKIYTPNIEVLKKLKEYVDSFETKIIPDERTAIVSEESVMKPRTFDIPVNVEHLKELEDNLNTFVALNNEESKIEPLYNNNEEILRNLLKDRLTEEEKTLIRIFGGRI